MLSRTITLPTDAQIAQIAQGLLDHTLPKAEWTHVAHWAAALWLLRHAPDQAAAMGDAIRTYNESVGGQNTDTAGYHETITRASLRAAADHLACHAPDAPLSEVLADLLSGHLGHPEWPLAFWRRETLFTPAARRAWVEPDLASLPF